MTPPVLNYGATRGGIAVDLEQLVRSRMLAIANSGGGKSRAIRSMLEQTHGKVQHLVIDVEGEFASLREHYDYVLAAKSGGDVEASTKTARLLCRRLVELGASAVLDLYDLTLHERREFVRLFLTELMALPRSLWKPIIIVIDEAHVFAPERGSGESQSLEAVISLATQGRKRGFCLVAATQRISKLHKDVAAELLNKMVGRTNLDVDLKRAGDELGLDKDARQALKTLAPGEFFVYGPAISNAVQTVRTADVVTTHPEAGRIGTAAPPAPKKVKALLAQLSDLPQQAATEARTVADLEALVKQLRGDLRRAQAGAPGIDKAELERQVSAAVERARSGWTREMRRLVGRDLAALDGTLDRTKAYVAKMPEMFSSVEARFLSLAGTFDNQNTLDSRAEVQVGNTKQDNGRQLSQRIDGGQQSRSTTRPVVTPVIPADGLTRPQQRMLDAMASFEALGITAIARPHVAVFSDQSSRSSGFRANLSTLSAAGYIERLGGDRVQLTDAGRSVASVSEAPATLDALHDAWAAKLSGPQQLMLMMLLREYPDGIEKDTLAKGSGQSPLSSGYRANLSTLSALGLIRRDNGRIVATELLFPEGLR